MLNGTSYLSKQCRTARAAFNLQPEAHSQLYALPSERFDARRVFDFLRRYRMSAPLEMGGARYPPTSLYVDFWFGHAALYCSS